MSDDEQSFGIEPDNNKETDSSFDFSTVEAEITEPLFTAPETPTRAQRWWERRKNKNTEDKSREKKVRKPVPPMPRGGLKPQLENFYVGVGMAAMPFDPTCARVIIENAERCADSMDELAKTSPAVRRALIRMVQTTAMGAVFAAHAPIVVAIMSHHIPALRERQEKMVGDMAEMFANMNADKKPGGDSE